MEMKLRKPMIFNWPLLSPQRPRCPSSFCSSSASSSRAPSFSSDITEFYDTTEDLSENIEQETLCAEGEIFGSPNLKAFTLKKLKLVTNDFHHDRVIGEGGLGRVYIGWIHEKTFTPSRPGSGMAVAVKIWNPSEIIQGHSEWQTEGHYLSQFRHPNIVKLIGFCSEDDQLALVYEYVQRGSLNNYLFKGHHRLSWSFRIKVAIGVAKGLSFLHDAEIPTIFRDIKSPKILLDTEFNAKLTGFGLAIAGPPGNETHISTQFMGTCGYADPEYVATGNLYVKSDVYSFGVVILELFSGHQVFDATRSRSRSRKRNLVEWAKPYLGCKEKLIRFMDPKLKGRYPEEGAHAVAKLALQCLADDPELRPNMSEVLTALEQPHMSLSLSLSEDLEVSVRHFYHRLSSRSPATLSRFTKNT